MDLVTGLSVGVFVYLAFTIQVAGFLSRDELLWRSLMFAASICYLIYYFNVSDTPLVDALIANGVLATVNLIMIGIVIKERSTFGMSDEHLALFRHFPLLNPGQFRRLVKVAERIEVAEPETIVSEGEVPDHLYFMLRGPVEIIKGATSVDIQPGIFIAEIAYLTGNAASATVRVKSGAVYLRWQTRDLQRLLARVRGLDAALIASFNADLAQKVAFSIPLNR